MDSSGASGSTSDAKAETTTAAASHPGCGCSSAGSITVRVTPTTGGQFDLQVAKTDSVENLKKLISKKLKVPKERICLLHRDRQLRDGTLQENQLMDGSRLTLLPSVETGLLAQRPEQSVMQALESLNDSQVNDFLSGKAPLNLTMRLGDHMMLIQLQLSTVTPSASRRTAKASAPSASGKQAPPTPKPPPAAAPPPPPSADAPAASASSAATAATASGSSEPCRCEPAARPTLDTRALAEASRNLTQTLKQLSSEDSARARRQGAIIESMHHHGKGVYSGTFSGTLNPALQDRFGRPKRDISTIIHILNDLLCATPQYRRHARHASSSASSSSSQAAGSASAATTSSAAAAVDPVSTTSQKPLPEKLTPSGQLPFSEESVSLSKENQATRGKMEHLRLIMEERRARRRARREARAAPYTTQWSAKSESLPTQQSVVEPMETTEQSTASELSPPEPVVA